MTEAACAWQMRIATDADPFMVSLVTSTMQVTVMALVMPAGVIADIVDRLKNGEIALLFNTTEGQQAIDDSRSIRAVALYDKIPYFTTAAASISAVQAMKARGEGIGVRTLQG